MDSIASNQGLKHIAEKIFMPLQFKDVLKCRLVNKFWKEVIDQPMFLIKKLEVTMSQRYRESKKVFDEECRMALEDGFLFNHETMKKIREKFEEVFGPLKTQESWKKILTFINSSQECPWFDLDQVQNDVKKHLLKQHTIIESLGKYDFGIPTALHLATQDGNPTFVKMILQIQPEMTSDRFNDNLPIYISIEKNNLAIFKMLLGSHKKYSPQHHFESIIQRATSIAVKYGKIDFVKILLQNVDD